MKKTFFYSAIIFVLIFTFSFNAYSDDFTNAMMKAKKNLTAALNTYDEKDLLKVRGEFERILQLKMNEWVVNYYMAYIDYNIATSGMKDQDNEKIKKYTQSGFAVIDKSIEQKDDFADSYVLKMCLTFNRWMYEQDKMDDIMAVTQQTDAAALKLDAMNPRYYLMKGISALYMPEAFGGGADASLKLLEKAYDIFQTRKEAEEYYPDWGYSMSFGFMATAFMKRDKEGDMEKAKTFIDKGLEKFPDSGMLKEVLKQYEEKTKKN
ncbi:MAG TPA: hypothetical protein VIL99_11585 [Ignavibacteria bacterium]